MSIIITGLEMPTERESFNLTIKYNGTVLDTETGMQVAEAHELPTHGRLIDGDALCKKLKIMYAKAFRDGNSAYNYDRLRAKSVEEMAEKIGVARGKLASLEAAQAEMAPVEKVSMADG